MSGTGSFETAIKVKIPLVESGILDISFINGTANPMVCGQSVFLSGDFEITPTTGLAAEFPIGVVSIAPEEATERVVVYTAFLTKQENAVIKVGAITAGSFVKQNGTITADDELEYIAAVTGDISTTLVLQGGLADARIIVATLANPHLIP